MPDLKRLVHEVVKRRKKWLPRVALGLGVVTVLLFFGTAVWQTAQDGTLNIIIAFSVFCIVCMSIFEFARSYWRVILVAVLGMVIGAVAGVFPYLVIVMILIPLELSTEGQATSRELSQLFNNDIFSQLFYVAGAASGGPIAVYVYIEKKKSDAEKGKGG